MGRRLGLLVVLLLSLGLLVGCPKQPEVGQVAPARVGPQATTPASSPSAAPAQPPGDVPVARPAPPAEIAVQPAAPAGSTAPAAAPLQDIFFDVVVEFENGSARPALWRVKGVFGASTPKKPPNSQAG